MCIYEVSTCSNCTQHAEGFDQLSTLYIIYYRMDTTLVDFNDMKWERGDITFIFNGEKKPSQSLIVMDNKLKVYQRIRYQVCDLMFPKPT